MLYRSEPLDKVQSFDLYRIIGYLLTLPLPRKLFIIYFCYNVYFYFFRDNPVETFRLHIFILREVIAVRETLRLANRARSFPGETNVTVTNLIMRSILVFDIRQLHLIDTLKIFLDQHVEHFCHEVYNFANSPYDISEYDRHIQHLYRPLLTESIVK